MSDIVTNRLTMTAKDRDELVSVLKMRARTIKTAIDAEKAKRLAEAEAELAALFSAEDERWKDVVAECRNMVDTANEHIGVVCAEARIPIEFAPGLALSFYGRGENSMAKRRAELRAVAATRAEALAREAKLQVELWEVEARADLASRSLSGDEARAWLDKLPPMHQLMPAIEVDTLMLTATVPRKAAGS